MKEKTTKNTENCRFMTCKIRRPRFEKPDSLKVCGIFWTYCIIITWGDVKPEKCPRGKFWFSRSWMELENSNFYQAFRWGWHCFSGATFWEPLTLTFTALVSYNGQFFSQYHSKTNGLIAYLKKLIDLYMDNIIGWKIFVYYSGKKSYESHFFQSDLRVDSPFISNSIAPSVKL